MAMREKREARTRKPKREFPDRKKKNGVGRPMPARKKKRTKRARPPTSRKTY